MQWNASTSKLPKQSLTIDLIPKVRFFNALEETYDVEQALVMRMTQRVETQFALAVSHILRQKQRLVEKHPLYLRRSDAKLLVLPRISSVPVEADDQMEA